METLLKLFLSSIGVLLCFGCTSTEKQKEENKKLAAAIWQKEMNKKEWDYSMQGTEKSDRIFKEIINLNPQHCDALREISIPYLKRGIPHKWRPLFDRAIACDSIEWQPWRGYLYLYFYRDYNKAIADFDASDRLTPKFYDAPQGHSVNYWRGIAYLGKKEYQNAIKYFELHISEELKSSTEDWIEPATFHYLGIAQYELKDFTGAAINFNKMLKYSNNKSADAHYYLALLNFDLKNFEKAALHNNAALKDFDTGYYRKHDYVEEFRQIYRPMILALKESTIQF